MDPSINICILENDHQHSQSHLQTHGRWAVKLLVHENKVTSKEEFLCFISLYIPAESIRAFVFDTYYNFHVLFLDNAEAFCILIGMTVKTEAFIINFLPLLDFFIVDNVYPCTSEDELRGIFENFGSVFQVNSYLALPNSSKFSHVISGRREISFILPKNKTDVFIPVNVFRPPYRFRVQKFCPVCFTEGHRVLECPNIKEIKVNQQLTLSSDEDGRKVKLSKTNTTDSINISDVGMPSASKAGGTQVSKESERVSEVESPITTTLEGGMQISQEWKRLSEVESPITTLLEEGGIVSQDSDSMSEAQSPVKITPESTSLPSSLKFGIASGEKLSDVTTVLSEKSTATPMPVLSPQKSVLEDKTMSVVISQTEVSNFSSEDSFFMESESNITSTSPQKRGRPRKSTYKKIVSPNPKCCVSKEAVPESCTNLEAPPIRKPAVRRKLPIETELPSQIETDSQCCANTETVPQKCSDEDLEALHIRKRLRPRKLPKTYYYTEETELPSEIETDSQCCANTETVPQSCSDEHNANSHPLSNVEEAIDGNKEDSLSKKVQEWLSLSTGVLPPKLIEEILGADVWTPSTISHSISRYSTDFRLVIEQLDKLLLECLNGTSFYHLYPKLVLFKKVVKKLQNS